VDCHTGPGTTWFLRSKLSGLKWVFAVALHAYPRPIPSPVQTLRSAQATCRQFPWLRRFTSDEFFVNTTNKDGKIDHATDDLRLM